MSLGGMLGTATGMGWRLVTGRWQESRQLMHGLKPRLQAFWRPVMHTLRVLFLEVTGLVYLCLTLTFIGALIREYHKFKSHQAGIGNLLLAGAVVAMFLYFGMSSLWRARQKRPQS